jgi:hypothetical protein
LGADEVARWNATSVELNWRLLLRNAEYRRPLLPIASRYITHCKPLEVFSSLSASNYSS